MMRGALVNILLVGLFGLTVYFRHQALVFREKLAAVEAQARQTLEPLRTGIVTARAATIAHTPAPAGVETPSPAAERAVAERDALIRQLEGAVRERDALLLSLQQTATNRPADSPRRQRGPQAWLDELRQNNPQQYAAITNRREQVRQAAQTSLAEKADYFRARDLSDMSEEDQLAYRRMTQLLDDTARLTEQLRIELPSDDRRAVMQTLRENMRELNPLLEFERSREWYSLGLQLGYQEDEAVAFGDYVNKIIDLTSMQSIWGMRAGAGGFRGMSNAAAASPAPPAR